ncbi:protein draper isoform X2 [Glossina fuscipes]|uniref:Protein draper isoform X2 n=1 Tax=Glossina fuscipes TaxID=7396 RepID=A0A9C5ZFD9_9MUSC|nr:protein draper isoform X2 [Glossina fuscipes]
MKAFSYIRFIIASQIINMIAAEWCIERKRVLLTRQRWQTGQRVVPRQRLFHTSYMWVPYQYSTIETYYEYVPERVCCNGYHQVDDNCEPTCYPSCSTNSTCFKPNLCRCTVGYYGNDDHSLLIKCSPYCEELCPPNSKCTAPNMCTCLEGYRKSPTGGEDCEPICNHRCDVNAYCEKPEVCACKKGYEMIDNRCEPICLQPCPDQARCIEPNRCLCVEGYQMQLTSRYEHYCEPICEIKCSTFGKCIAPNKCECFNDYKLNANTSICEPICSSGCENGQCLSPNMCVCNKGYLMGPDNKCQPICSQSCKQGRCIRPEQCECEKGFRLEKNSTVLCQPICEPPCTNGDCVAPNFCVCHKDYKHPDDYKYHICEKSISLSTSTSETTEDFTETSTTTEIYTMADTTIDPLKFLKDDVTTSTVEHTGIKLPQTSNDSKTFTSLTECLKHCQCWQEYDDFGPLSTTTCTAFCTYENDQQCLKGSLCKCDWKLKRMICHLADGESFDDIPSLYQCKANALTAKVPELEKRSAKEETSAYLLWLGIGSGLVILIILTNCIIYWKFSTRNSDYLVQYEQQSSN